jgi:hypothetical protein
LPLSNKVKEGESYKKIHRNPPSLFQREGEGGESERKNKRRECLFKPLKSKIKALKIIVFFKHFFG